MLKKIAKVLTKKPAVVIIAAAALLVLSLFGYIATRVNYDILAYLPQNLESTRGVHLLEDPFKMSATTMVVIDDMPPAYTNELVEEIKEVPGVTNVLWLSNIVGVQIPKDMVPAQFRDTFFSDEGTMLLVQYEKSAASDETMKAISSIRSICREKCFVSGFSALVKDTRDLVNREMPLYILVAVILSLIAMELSFDSFVLPFVLMANIGLAIIYNFGSNVFLGEISYVTQAIAAVLQLGVTMDYSIFLYNRYKEEQKTHPDKKEAMSEAIVAAFTSLTSSSLTTVAGFLALCFMRLTLGRDIGIVMAKGVLLGIITVITILPSLILVADKYIEKTKHKSLIPDFSKLNSWIIKHAKLIAIIGLLLFIPAMYAEKNLDIYYKIDESLPDTLPSKVAAKKLSDDYDMASSHYIVLRDDLPDSAMNEMEESIKNVPGIRNVISYHSLLGSGVPEFFVPDSLKSMLRAGGYQLVMINSEIELATDAMTEQLNEIKSIVKKCDPSAMVSGEPAMTQDLIDTAKIDFNVTNYISIAAIFLIIAIVFRSVSLPVLLVAAIELAICVNQGISYFTGADVAFVTPTVICAVQLGATVDYAILMTSRFQEAIRQGYGREEAIHIAANASDGSIIVSALVLFCATVGVSLVCTIDMVGSICIMLARGSIISAIVSIFLVPSILYLAEPLIGKTTINWNGLTKKKQEV